MFSLNKNKVMSAVYGVVAVAAVSWALFNKNTQCQECAGPLGSHTVHCTRS